MCFNPRWRMCQACPRCHKKRPTLPLPPLPSLRWQHVSWDARGFLLELERKTDLSGNLAGALGARVAGKKLCVHRAETAACTARVGPQESPSAHLCFEKQKCKSWLAAWQEEPEVPAGSGLLAASQNTRQPLEVPVSPRSASPREVGSEQNCRAGGGSGE